MITQYFVRHALKNGILAGREILEIFPFTFTDLPTPSEDIFYMGQLQVSYDPQEPTILHLAGAEQIEIYFPNYGEILFFKSIEPVTGWTYLFTGYKITLV